MTGYLSQFKEDTGKSSVAAQEINPTTYLLHSSDQAGIWAPVLSLSNCRPRRSRYRQ